MLKQYKYHKGKKFKFTGSYFAWDPIYGREGERILVDKDTDEIILHYQLGDQPASLPAKK